MRAKTRAKTRATWTLLLFFLATLTLDAQELSLRFSREVAPGGVITLELISPEPLEEVSVALLDGENTLSSNQGVELSGAEEAQRWVSLLGVSSLVRPGEYELRISADQGVELRRRVRVTEREFGLEEIRLNESASELRREEDPQKREEALEMIALTNRFDEGAQFWFDQFRIPLEYSRRTSLYGNRRRFIYADGGQARAIHYGLDFAAPTGTPVYAPGAGRVVFAAPRIVTGNSVVVEHFPGVYGLFYHLDSISVSPGDLLEPGDELGTVGSTGVSTGPHLHWELRVGGVSVDPSSFLDVPLVDIDE
ncbi:MAG: M23 family metallopeptidase [Alkalispirochaetaceae bacterium]